MSDSRYEIFPPIRAYGGPLPAARQLASVCLETPRHSAANGGESSFRRHPPRMAAICIDSARISRSSVARSQPSAASRTVTTESFTLITTAFPLTPSVPILTAVREVGLVIWGAV